MHNPTTHRTHPRALGSPVQSFHSSDLDLTELDSFHTFHGPLVQSRPIHIRLYPIYPPSLLSIPIYHSPWQTRTVLSLLSSTLLRPSLFLFYTSLLPFLISSSHCPSAPRSDPTPHRAPYNSTRAQVQAVTIQIFTVQVVTVLHTSVSAP